MAYSYTLALGECNRTSFNYFNGVDAGVDKLTVTLNYTKLTEEE